MASVKETLAVRHGVVLQQVTLYTGSFPMDTAFVVKIRRTREAPNFENMMKARQYFDEEVERCAHLISDGLNS